MKKNKSKANTSKSRTNLTNSTNRSQRTIISVEKTEFTLLSKIQTPADLRKLTVDELPQLCDELRRDIVEEVAVNPGRNCNTRNRNAR